MAKTKISEFSTTPGNNTDINGINIAEGCAPSGINNAIRELMSDLKEWQSGAMDVYVIPQGTAAAPGIQLYGDLDTGLYGYAANQLGVAVGGASAGYFSSDGWVGNVVATTIDLTNIEVTNIKAKDGTAAITIADSTGVVSVSTQLAVDNLNLSGNTLSSSDTNGNIILAPNGTGDVYLDADTIRVGDSNTNVTITSNGTADLILNTNSGTNSGSITIEDGVNGNIIIAPNGTGQVQITNAALDLTTIEVTNIKAKDGTAAASIADSTGAITVTKDLTANGVTLGKGLGSVLTNTALGRSALAANTVGDLNTAVGNLSLTSNTGGTGNTAVGHVAMTSHQGGSLNTAVGAGSLTANLNGNNNTAIGQSALGTATGSNNTAVGSAAGSLITNGNKNTIIGNYDGNQGGLDIRTASNYIVLSDGDGNPRAYWNGANATFGGTLTATTITGTQVNSDNLRLDGNTLSSTDTNGNIVIAPNGTGQVQLSGALDVTNIEVTNIKAKDGTAALSIADSTGVVSVSANPVLSGGTANGVLYLNASKVATSGSALTFDGTTLGVTGVFKTFNSAAGGPVDSIYTGTTAGAVLGQFRAYGTGAGVTAEGVFRTVLDSGSITSANFQWLLNNSEQMRLTSTGLGIGTSSPAEKLDVNGNANLRFAGISGSADLAFPYPAATNARTIIRATGTGDWRQTLSVLMNTSQSDTAPVNVFTIGNSGNVGIGTSSPGAKLTIGAAGALRLNRSDNATYGEINYGGSGVGIKFNDANSDGYTFQNGGSTVMRLDSSGNLGLGVTPSTWTVGKVFQIGATGNGFLYGATTSGTSTIYGVNARYASGWIYDANGYSTRYNQDAGSGQHQWFTAPSGTAGNAISFTQAMTLDASGNLVIGDTSASYRLDVKGSTGNGIAYRDGTVTNYLGTTGSNLGYLGTLTNHPVAFLTNATERARITSGGSLLVGTTSATGTLSTGVQVSSTNWASAFEVTASANSGTCSALSRSTDGNVAQFYQGTAFTTLVGSISVTSTATAFNQSSDYRLKDNPQPLTGSGAFIDALQPKTWDWKIDGSRGVGFIAHEVQAVSPTSVTGQKDAVDDEGNPVMQQMAYGSAEFIANIIAELQSLRARVAQLEGK